MDTRGHRCPVPTLRLRRALERAAPGARVRLIADDPLALIDVPIFVKQAGQTIEYQSNEGDLITFQIVKAAPPC